MTRSPHVAVVGAGVFGGWSALSLLRQGARVTLVDAWGAGNSRSSSGGDTRVIRHTYQERTYVDMVAEALPAWRELAARSDRALYEERGVLWMAQRDDAQARSPVLHLQAAGIPHEVLNANEIRRRYPAMNVQGIRRGVYEPHAGVLLARRACQAVTDLLIAEGGEIRLGEARAPRASGGRLEALALGPSGDTLEADAYVFACGPWLPALFPGLLGEVLRVTRQEVFIFGVPGGDDGAAAASLPVWADDGERFWYGIPDAEGRGFKVADDTKGEPFDPMGDRIPSAEGAERARAYIGMRFPFLAGAPLLEARVCQYTNTRDNHLILDAHPEMSNVWIAGGGSGHGFKLGPAVGARMAAMVLEGSAAEPVFSLAPG